MKIEKPCKLCRVKRYANTSYCWKHYRETEKEKKELKLKKKKERKESSKKFQESLRKMLHKKAWKLQSEWIRRKDADLDGNVECYTCYAVKHYSEMNAGHFKHDRLDFDDDNLKPQCVQCNLHNSGRLDVYATRLIEENGLEWVKNLERKAHEYNKYTPEILMNIIKDLKFKISRYEDIY